MRYLPIYLFFASTLALGCASTIAGFGPCPRYDTRDQAFADLGKPQKTEIVDGKLVDVYYYHGLIRDSERTMDEGMLAAMTVGLADIVFVPYELCIATKELVIGTTIRISYDDNNKRVATTVDGISK
jgi:hypothetical protein